MKILSQKWRDNINAVVACIIIFLIVLFIILMFIEPFKVLINKHPYKSSFYLFSLILSFVMYIVYFNINSSRQMFIFKEIRNLMLIYFISIFFVRIKQGSGVLVTQEDSILICFVLNIFIKYLACNSVFEKQSKWRLVNYYKKSEFFHNYIITFIGYMAIPFLLYCIPYSMDLSFFLFIANSILALGTYPYDEDKITLEIININYKEAKELLYVSQYIKEDNNCNLILVNANKIFPDNAINKEILITNHLFYGNDESRKNEYFYIAIPINAKSIIPFDMKVKYVLNNKVYVKHRYFYIENECYGGINFSYTSRCLFHKMNLFKKLNLYSYQMKKNLSENTLIKNSIFSSYYYKNAEIIEKELFINAVDTRRFIKHDGDFGIGKSTYDIFLIANQGKKPIVISPWEENYDHDILYLIFKKIKRKSSIKIYPEAIKHCPMIFLAAFFPIIGLLITIYNYLFNYFSIQNKSSTSLLLIMVILVLISFLLDTYLIPNIIIFKKDYSIVYQEFFLEAIKRMLLSDGDLILLVEDIDRLNEHACDNTFRVVSAINRIFYLQQRIIGVLSYASNNLASISEQMKKTIDDIDNKLCFYNIGDDYYDYDSKMLKIDALCIYFAERQLSNTEKEIQEKAYKEIKQNISKINFRDLNQCIIEVINKENTLDYGLLNSKINLFVNNIKKKKSERECYDNKIGKQESHE